MVALIVRTALMVALNCTNSFDGDFDGGNRLSCIQQQLVLGVQVKGTIKSSTVHLRTTTCHQELPVVDCDYFRLHFL